MVSFLVGLGIGGISGIVGSIYYFMRGSKG